MSVKVCKFGGTAMADADTIRKVKDIIESDPLRRFIVVSAPGKRFASDKKITDILFECHNDLLNSGTCRKRFSAVRSRFIDIVKQLKLTIDICTVLDKTFDRIEKEKSEQFTVSRGEYLCGIVLAEYLGMQFVDAEDIFFFNEDGTLNANKTYTTVAAVASKAGKAVIPGFYGVDSKGCIRTFSRGGSDITGAVVACAVNATLYENWTDVSCFLACDPNIVDNPKPIQTMSYSELRDLSYMGAKVLHSESVFHVSKASIPIQIKNTFSPKDDGTEILPDYLFNPKRRTLTGIAGRKNFTMICIEKLCINSKIGFVREALSVVEAENIPVEHIPTGVDTVSLLIDNSKLTEIKLRKILETIKYEINPDSLKITENIALIALVGHGMLMSADTIARFFKAMSSAQTDVKAIDMGSSEQNIIVGVKDADYERCIKAIYSEFFEK